jgi:dienelactone hydrolase
MAAAKLVVLGLLLLARPVSAAPAPLFPPLGPEETPRARLTRALTTLGHAQLGARFEITDRITTRPALEKRRAVVKATLLRLFSGLPTARTPLRPRVVGRLEREGFIVDKVIFESQPGFLVTANLYLPRAGQGPFPGVIAPVGHGDLGKAGERRGPDLARKGFVVLVPDPPGQGERLQHYDPELRASRAGGSTDEHGQAATRAALIGDNVASVFLWDAMRGVDYLLSRPEVDPNRVGATGCSGGGTIATYLAALDDRVRVAAIACYLTDWDRLLDGPGPQEAEQSFPGFLAAGLDMADYLALIAPRPLLVAATTEDFFPLAGTRSLFEEGRRYYSILGADDRLGLFVGPGGHGTPRESREAISSFLLRWLGNGGDPREPPDSGLTPEELQCTSTGQLATGEKSLTIAELVRSRAQGLAPRPLPADAQALPEFRRRLAVDAAQVASIAARPGGSAPALTVHRSVGRDGYRLDVITLAPEKDVLLWGLLAVPSGAALRPAVLMADPSLRGKLSELGGDLDQLARAGQVVLAIEPRGAQTDPEPGRPSLLGSAAVLQRRAEVVGKTLVGLRAEDLLHAVDLLAARPEVDRSRIAAFATGPYAVPLLHAAVLDQRLSRVIVRDTQISYRAVLDHSIHRDLPEIALPGVLRSYDLTDLMVALAPRPLTIVNPLDPVGQSLPRRELDDRLGPVLEAAGRLGQRVRVLRRGGAALLLESAR